MSWVWQNLSDYSVRNVSRGEDRWQHQPTGISLVLWGQPLASIVNPEFYSLGYFAVASEVALPVFKALSLRHAKMCACSCLLRAFILNHVQMFYVSQSWVIVSSLQVPVFDIIIKSMHSEIWVPGVSHTSLLITQATSLLFPHHFWLLACLLWDRISLLCNLPVLELAMQSRLTLRSQKFSCL